MNFIRVFLLLLFCNVANVQAQCDCMTSQVVEEESFMKDYERIKGFKATWTDDSTKTFSYTTILKKNRKYLWKIYNKKGNPNNRLKVELKNTKWEVLTSNINSRGYSTEFQFIPQKKHLYILEINLVQPEYDYCNCGYVVLYVKKDDGK